MIGNIFDGTALNWIQTGSRVRRFNILEGDFQAAMTGKLDEVNRTAIPTGPTPANVDTGKATEGGLRGASTVLGCWLILVATFGYTYTFGVFQDYYTRFYLKNYSASTISWIGGVQLTIPFFFGTISGKLFDDGYFHSLQIAGSLLFTFSLFMLSLAKPFQFYQIFLSQGIGLGLGFAMIFVPSIAVQSRYYKRRRALATGIILSGNSIGGVIFPIMLNKLFKTHSFGNSVRASAYIVLGLVTLGNLLIRSPPNVPPPSSLPASAQQDTGNVKQTRIWSYLQEVPYLLLTINVFVAAFGLYFPVIYGQLYAVQHNVDENLAFYMLPILNASSAFGRIFGNMFADWLGAFTMLGTCTLVSAVLLWLIIKITNTATLIVITILYGFFSGAYLSLLTLGIAQLSKSPKEIGARTGIASTATAIGTLFSAPIQGALLARNFIWIRPIAFSASMLFGASILVFAVRAMVAREKGVQCV